MTMIFKNRKEAAELLAERLEAYRHKNAIVLGVPRGGVETAFYVARYLDAELSVIISRKLPYPGYEEFGFGSVAEEGLVYVAHLPPGLSEGFVAEIAEIKQREIGERIIKFRNGESLPCLSGRTVILVDDGIATGVSLVPLIRLCKSKNPEKLIVAAPVSGTLYDPGLRDADELVILQQPPHFRAVGEFYGDFRQLRDEDVVSFLNQSKAMHNEHS